MSFIQPLKFRTLKMGRFKMSHLQMPHLQMAVFQMVVTIASWQYILHSTYLNRVHTYVQYTSCHVCKGQNIDNLRRLLEKAVGHALFILSYLNHYFSSHVCPSVHHPLVCVSYFFLLKSPWDFPDPRWAVLTPVGARARFTTSKLLVLNKTI